LSIKPGEPERAINADYDLEERRLEYSARVIRLSERLPLSIAQR
jgi:hypothetical protein